MAAIDGAVFGVVVLVGRRRSELLTLIRQWDVAAPVALLSVIFVAGSAADVAPFQWVAPFTGVTVAEKFILAGMDAVVVFNDLSRHANAYR